MIEYKDLNDILKHFGFSVQSFAAFYGFSRYYIVYRKRRKKLLDFQMKKLLYDFISEKTGLNNAQISFEIEAVLQKKAPN